MASFSFRDSNIILKTLVFLTAISYANCVDIYLNSARSIDDLLFSDDLFPGHVIPKGTSHNEAIKTFTRIMEDSHVLHSAYDKYRLQHNKENDDDNLKLEIRKGHFKENLHLIFSHNLQEDAGNAKFQLGVNDFADMSTEEMKMFLGSNDKLTIPVHPRHNASAPVPPQSQPVFSAPPAQFPQPNLIYPIKFDFREEKLITSVRNQGRCGSCVFFAFAALIEALIALAREGIHVNVSEQMMLDCATPEFGYTNNAGCHGNIMEDTAQFLVDHGVTTEILYKYKGKQGVCDKDTKDIVARLEKYWQVEGTPEAFKDTLVNQRLPIAVAFHVFKQFMFYRSGVFDSCTPPNGAIGGHAVLITGYGHFIDQGYWVVKNSWGVKWGEAGFFRYAIGAPFCKFERWGFTGILA